MHKTKRLPNFVQELDDLLTNPNKEMSNKLNEENVQAEKTKKMPYNLREKKILLKQWKYLYLLPII